MKGHVTREDGSSFENSAIGSVDELSTSTLVSSRDGGFTLRGSAFAEAGGVRLFGDALQGVRTATLQHPALQGAVMRHDTILAQWGCAALHGRPEGPQPL